MRTVFALIILSVTSHISAAQSNCDELKKENESLKKSLHINTPTKTVTSSKIDFNLLKCEGNSKDQTISVILTLVNHDANRRILISPAKGIDIEGNEYRSEKITIGTDSGSNDLYTDIPLKTVITLSRVLPSVKILKIVPLECFDPASGHFNVELKDLTINWK